MPPFGVPSVALDRRFLTGALGLRTVGLDISVTYSAAQYNPVTGVIAVGGDTSTNVPYMGMLSDGIFGDLIEAPAIPALGAAVRPGGIAVNKIDGGWLVVGAVHTAFRAPADMSAWVDITPPSGVIRKCIIEWRGRIFMGNTNGAPPGSGNIEFSDDNGATWDSVPGIITGIVQLLNAFYSDPSETVLLAIADAGTDAGFSKSPGAGTGSWTLIPVGNLGTPMNDAAISDDGQKAAIVSNNGDITVTDDAFNTFTSIPIADNPFRSSAASGWGIENIEYVTDLGGFVLCSNIANDRRAFIDENDMERVFMTSHLGEGMTLGDRCGASDGENAFFIGASNLGVCTFRKIGQPGKT